jgi:hypothetical protein
MAEIPASKVRVRRRYIVYCDVCEEGVDPERPSGFETREDAEAAKTQHLELHASEEL